MGFIYAETEGLLGGAATQAGLAGEMAGHGGQAAGAGAVVAPGLEEVSAYNVARIQAYTANVASVLATGSLQQGLYGLTMGVSGAGYELTDDLLGIGLAGA
jgi:hypothetical protein